MSQMTKEERKAYNKEYYQENKEEIKAYKQSPAGMKVKRKCHWKKQGIIFNDVDKFYVLYLSITQCQICKKKLTVDKKITHSTKSVDHDHNITDGPNVRYICCHACNANDKSNNTSGEPNISYYKRRSKWYFHKTIKGQRYTSPEFKTKQETIHYKYSFLHKLKQIEINKQITSQLSSGTCRKHQTVRR